MKIKSIKYVGKEDQQCIRIKDPNGLFVTNEGIISHNSPEKVTRTFKKTKARVASRMKGNYYGRMVLDSSPNSMENPMDLWINNDAPKSKENFIVRGSLWDLNKNAFPHIYTNGNDKPPVYTNDNSFCIFTGGNGELPYVIDRQMTENFAATDLIEVPNASAEGVSLRDSAEEDVLNFIRDQAGRPTDGAERVFYDLIKVENMFVDGLRNMYYGITASAADAPENLIWNKIKDKFFKKVLNKYLFWYKPEAVRVLSVDQSINGDVTGISVSHAERDPNNLDEQGNAKTIYITDFTIVILPQKNDRINLDAIKFFIIDLIKIGNLRINHISFDRFQSEATIQYLKRYGLDVEYLSVDLTDDPYISYISLYLQERLKVGRNIFFKNNLLSIRETFRKVRSDSNGSKKGGRKYDHTPGELINTPPEGWSEAIPDSWKKSWKTSKTGINAKDVLDCTVANIELLRKHNIVGYDLWEPEKLCDTGYDSTKKKLLESFAQKSWKI